MEFGKFARPHLGSGGAYSASSVAGTAASQKACRRAEEHVPAMDTAALDETQCEQDDLADLVDFDATHEEVLSRIEHCVSAFLEELSFGRLQSIQTVHFS